MEASNKDSPQSIEDEKIWLKTPDLRRTLWTEILMNHIYIYSS